MKATRTFLTGALTALTIGAAGLFTAATATADHHKNHMEKAEVGHKAPDFTLEDLSGKKHTLSDYTEDGKIVVLEWFNPDCPYVVKHHERHNTMAETAAKYESDGVVWIAINSGREGHSTTGVDRNKRAMKKWNMDTPILLDETGKVGQMYGAKTTPHMYIIDTDGMLRYNGAIDNDRSPYELGSVNYVDQALSQIMSGSKVATAETRPYGCSVKY